MERNSKRNIPFKNYIIVLLIIIGVIILTLFLFKKDENLTQSDLYRIVYEIKYEELNSSVFVETTEDYFIYVSYLDDNNVSKLEEEVKEIIIENDLQNNFYYLNVTDLREEANFIENLNDKLGLNDEIEYLPAIVFYRDNQFKKVINSKKNKLLDVKELRKIIDNFELE